MRFLVLTNTIDLGEALMRFLRFTESEPYDTSFLTFSDLRMLSQDILNTNFLITEAVNIEDDSLESKGIEFLLSFNRIGKKVMLFYIDAVPTKLTKNLEYIVLKLPFDLPEFSNKLSRLISSPMITLNEHDKLILEQMFPYKTVKDHHHRKGILG
ncbi:MAG TPA: hypothetical protein EYP58_02385 [bacterium (Candidatus Stahlbacteria)]|nr:hypothetical protein [Candidatus Stahlbacteria bacterium]